MIGFRHFLGDERGTASIEFIFVVPTVMLIFTASFESSMFMARHVMLERSVDIVVRDIRLGKLDGLTHTQLKKLVCETSALVGSVDTCMKSMRIWMQPVNTANFDMPAPPRGCVDKSAPPVSTEPAATEFRFGSDNELMLLHICLKEEPMFPTSVVGAGLIRDETDGNYALLARSVFVNEPG